LFDVPHAKQALFSPGGVLPTLTAYGNVATLLLGQQRQNMDEISINNSATNGFIGTSGVDPGVLWYFLVGYQNMAGTTTTNQQAQISIEYTVKWWQPIGVAVQQLTERNKWGGEEVPSKAELEERKRKVSSESSSALMSAAVEQIPGTKQFRSIDLNITETKGMPPLKKATVPTGASLFDDDDDDDEREFMEYLRKKFKARSAVRQALAFEESDFSGTRSVGSGIQ